MDDNDDDDADDYEALLTTHMTSRRCNADDYVAEERRRLSRRELEQARTIAERQARGLADGAPANPQPAFFYACHTVECERCNFRSSTGRQQQTPA